MPSRAERFTTMRVRNWIWLLLPTILISVSACGRAPGSSDLTSPGPVQTSPTSSSPPTPSIPPNWQTYSDSTYSFTIAYPSNFTFKKEGGADPTEGWLAEFRAIDNKYLDGYPPGQVEVGIYAYDSDSLTNWIAKHTGTSSPPNHSQYWSSATNIQPTSVVARSAIAFDVTVSGFPVTGHTTAFIQNLTRVIVVNWWSTDPANTSTVGDVAKQMLGSFNG